MLRSRGDTNFGELSDLKTLVGRRGKEDIYKCPYCHELGKSPDEQGKLYFNPIKQIGHCFRCETIIVSKGLRSIEAIRSQLDERPEEERYDEQILSIDDWTTPVEEQRNCYFYMIQDRRIFPEVLRLFNIKACKIPRTGIVFCNKIWKDPILGNLTDFLTIRNIFSQVKHTIIREQVKPLLWSSKPFSKKLVLVEGTVSGLSAFQHSDGELSPAVLLGKTLSDFQKGQLREIVSRGLVKEIYVCCDGGFFENTLKIAKEIYATIPNIEILVTILPWGRDPNDLSKREFKEAIRLSWIYEPLRAGLIRNQAYGSN